MAAFFGLLAAWPALVVAALMIRGDGGPVFFRQVRVGRHGKPFTIYKLRTMRPAGERPRRQFTTSRDPLVTPVGRVLRKLKIDELPQLMNVLKGDMSLVGPRPEVPQYTALWPKEIKARVLSVRPGLTDFASLQYINEQEILGRQKDVDSFYRNCILPHKLLLNLAYVENQSFKLDLMLLACTVLALIGAGDGFFCSHLAPGPLKRNW